tara:strand:- start:346 stop:615 length:270 start_codon:yes stop_codon:yes gene_type:complete
MEEFIAKVTFSQGEMATIKNYAKNIFEVIDNLAQMDEIIHIFKVVRTSDNKTYNLDQEPISFLEIKQARKKIHSDEEGSLRRSLKNLKT